jgi:hypothetical protein
MGYDFASQVRFISFSLQKRPQGINGTIILSDYRPEVAKEAKNYTIFVFI